MRKRGSEGERGRARERGVRVRFFGCRRLMGYRLISTIFLNFLSASFMDSFMDFNIKNHGIQDFSIVPGTLLGP